MDYNKILDFYIENLKLEEVNRKGWELREVPAKRMESDSDHIFQTMVLASTLARELEIDVDMGRLLEMLLFHEVGEIVFGDVAMVEDGYKEFKQNEKVGAKKIFDCLSPEVSDYYYSLWKEMDEKSTPLGKFAYLIDKVDAVIKAGIYEEKYSVEGLFEEFYSHQKEKGNFDGTMLDEFFEFIETRFLKGKQK